MTAKRHQKVSIYERLIYPYLNNNANNVNFVMLQSISGNEPLQFHHHPCAQTRGGKFDFPAFYRVVLRVLQVCKGFASDIMDYPHKTKCNYLPLNFLITSNSNPQTSLNKRYETNRMYLTIFSLFYFYWKIVHSENIPKLNGWCVWQKETIYEWFSSGFQIEQINVQKMNAFKWI